MSIFILGGGGFLGSAIVRYCRQHGLEHVSIDRANYHDYVGHSCATLVNADGNSKKWVAAETPGRDFEESVVSVQTSLKDFSFDHYAYVSSCDVYPDVGEPALNDETTPIEVGRQSHYGFHKLIAEQVVRHHVKTWMILRLGGLIGEGLKKGPIYDLVHGAPLRVHIDSEYQYLDTDVAAAVLFSLAGASRWNEVFNVAGVGTVSLRDVARSIGCMGTGREATGRPERYHINIDKIRRLYRIPDTGAAVSEFLSRGGSSA